MGTLFYHQLMLLGLFQTVHQLCSILKNIVFKVIWLFVTGAREGLVTDDVISCVVPWEIVMQPRNDDDFVVRFRRQVA